MMTLGSLIETYGYLGILIGTFLEGETTLVLGGFAAHRGYLALPWVIFAAFIGSLCGDQLFFYLGRKHSQKILTWRPSWKTRMDKAQRVLGRFRTPMILAFRFMYGFRTVLPFLLGMSSVPTRQFVLLSAIGAFVWAIVVGTGGYLFGQALEIFIGNLKHHELKIFGAIAAMGALTWTIYLYRRARKHASSDTARENSTE